MKGMLLISAPKSGTMFLSAMFRQGLGLEPCRLSSQYFPRDLIDLDAMRQWAKDGLYAGGHMDASPQNLAILDRFAERWVVHLRDPRAITLSMTHHVARLAAEGNHDELLRLCPAPPIGARLEWFAKNFLPSVVAWEDAWRCAAIGRPILLTDYTDLVGQEERYGRRVCEFLGLEGYVHRAPTKDAAVHYRSGRPDEWREHDALASLEMG